MSFLRRLNERGMNQLRDFLHQVKTNSNLAPPFDILTHESTSEGLGDIEVRYKHFGSRFSAAEYLYPLLDVSGLPDIEQDSGLWSWLALFYFEELCPAGKNGKRNPGEDARWIPASNHAFRYYRHLLAGPYRIFKAHKDNPECAMILLCGPLDKPGEIVEQLASRQELVTNSALLGSATTLYLNQDTGLPKRGVTVTEKHNDKTRGKPGTVRRLVDVFKQFDRVWDLYSMSPDSVVNILPDEFKKWNK